jgi:Mg/Co/Ni transporter MgtE
LNITNLSFDELIEKLAQMTEDEVASILPKLDDDTKQKIQNMIEGGLI